MDMLSKRTGPANLLKNSPENELITVNGVGVGRAHLAVPIGGSATAQACDVGAGFDRRDFFAGAAAWVTAPAASGPAGAGAACFKS